VIGVIGAGAFGTALAVVQAQAGRAVTLWGRDGAAMARMRSDRMNAERLPGVTLPPAMKCAADLKALDGAEALLIALPAQMTGAFLAEHGAALPLAPLVLCAKGLGRERFRLQSAIAAEACPERPLAVLTGPGFAGEIAHGLPTALTLASADANLARDLQALLATPRMRLYATEDMTGAQIGGALKNVTAIACGMSDGALLGHSARAALMTRGFAEMTRLAVAMGARAETLAGLSGLGDLSLTCNSAQSRNFALGLALGSGREPPGGTVEGVATARAACRLAATLDVEMPIAAAVADVLDGTMTLNQAMDALLSRPLKEE
jgi:glycerol-3-phosphate dehydrogenase (NAD(P)+)